MSAATAAPKHTDGLAGRVAAKTGRVGIGHDVCHVLARHLQRRCAAKERVCGRRQRRRFRHWVVGHRRVESLLREAVGGEGNLAVVPKLVAAVVRRAARVLGPEPSFNLLRTSAMDNPPARVHMFGCRTCCEGRGCGHGSEFNGVPVQVFKLLMES